MAELIQNGFFNDIHMEPWERCVDNELGESWICHSGEEPDFDREHWHYTAANLTDYNPVFISDYNLELNENDAVKQSISSDVRATGHFHFWAQCGAPDVSAPGDLYAIVCYGDHTFDYSKIAHEDAGFGPTFVSVHVQSKRIEKVIICVVDSHDPWYITAISMEGADAKSIRPHAHLESRIAMLEEKVNHLYRAVAKNHKNMLDLSGKVKKKV
jgi:hypothetical protein